MAALFWEVGHGCRHKQHHSGCLAFVSEQAVALAPARAAADTKRVTDSINHDEVIASSEEDDEGKPEI